MQPVVPAKKFDERHIMSDSLKFENQLHSSLFNSSHPMVAKMKNNATDAMEFQMWVAGQTHSLAKLKTFATMVQKVNDAQ